jgi:hypothetical protein
MSEQLTRDDFIRDTIRAHAAIEERLASRIQRLEAVISDWWEESPPESFAVAQRVANLMRWEENHSRTQTPPPGG